MEGESYRDLVDVCVCVCVELYRRMRSVERDFHTDLTN